MTRAGNSATRVGTTYGGQHQSAGRPVKRKIRTTNGEVELKVPRLQQAPLKRRSSRVTPDGRYLVTDAYPGEKVVLENREVPIRLLDTVSDEAAVICHVYTLGRKDDIGKGRLRLDPHPAWGRDYRKVCFNGAPEGRRQVFVADLSDVL